MTPAVPAVEDRVFRPPSVRAAEAAIRALRETLRLGPPVREDVTRTFLDTFDWRLYRRGEVLTATPRAGKHELRWAGRDGEHRQLVTTVPGLVGDLPAGRFREALAPVLEMRRLLPVATARQRRRVWPVLDERDKTVLRLALEESSAAASAQSRRWHELPLNLRLRPLRGYPLPLDRAAAIVEQCGIEAEELPLFDQTLAALGIEAGDDPSKLRLELRPGTPAVDAACAIHRALLGIIEVNLPGVIDDVDSEFLHDLRVAVRRLRSALSQIRGVFPDPVVEEFKERFRWLGRVTGPTRDLDVFLLQLHDHPMRLPDRRRADLAPLERHLAGEQRREQRRMARALRSARFGKLIADWRAFLDAAPAVEPPPAAARRPAEELAARRIRRVHRRVLEDGRRIDAASPVAALHALRIRCKKLRYLLEFFRSLFDPDLVAACVKVLKKLQDNLGRFNDCTVQIAALDRHAEALARAGSVQPSTLLAMGWLAAGIEARQQLERERFHDVFAEFARGSHRRVFDRLLAR